MIYKSNTLGEKKMKKLLTFLLVAIIAFSAITSTTVAQAASKNTVKTSISKVESKATGFKVTWKKKSNIKGYQIQYSTSSKFKKSSTKTKTISKAKTISATINKLNSCNKKYHVRIRTYKVIKGKKVYSAWSKVKSVTTLKHKYSKATCTKAKTCKYCKKTSGKKLAHTYSKATCTNPKKCTGCGVTKGTTTGHNYVDNKCKTCKTAITIKDVSNTYLYYTQTLTVTDNKNGTFSFTCEAGHSSSGVSVYNQKIVGYDAMGNETFSDIVPTYYMNFITSYIKYSNVPATTTVIMVSDYF